VIQRAALGGRGRRRSLCEFQVHAGYLRAKGSGVPRARLLGRDGGDRDGPHANGLGQRLVADELNHNAIRGRDRSSGHDDARLRPERGGRAQVPHAKRDVIDRRAGRSTGGLPAANHDEGAR